MDINTTSDMLKFVSLLSVLCPCQQNQNEVFSPTYFSYPKNQYLELEQNTWQYTLTKI